MGHRLTKIYTKTGDQGFTGLCPQSRLRKDDIRIQAMGDVDELNAIIGMLITYPLVVSHQEILTYIQHRLFDIGGQICMPTYQALKISDVEMLEQWIDEQNQMLPALKEFILPGGCQEAAFCHIARTVCRRAERSLVGYVHADVENGLIFSISLSYLNRLSDWLFVLARILNHSAGQTDIFWQKASC